MHLLKETKISMNQSRKTNENAYIVKSLISGDGCGSLYTLEGTDSILRKIDDSFRNKYSSEKFLKNVDLLSSLIGEKNLAIPTDFVKGPFVGYTFQSEVCDMPLSDILVYNNKEYSHLNWMRKTGNVLRRIKILLRISELLAKIHLKGFVICNFSPSNFLINKDAYSSEVFLASTEWICYKAETMRPICVNKYTAPEVASGFITNTYSSDCYSFALLVYELLCFHSIAPSTITADDINACKYIAPEIQQMLISSLIKGRENINIRPAMDEWRNCLEKCLSKYILCPNCGTAYPYLKGRSCPECKTVSTHVYTLAIRYWNKVEEFKNGDIQLVMDLMGENEYKTILNPSTLQSIPEKWLDENLSDKEIATISILQYNGFDFIHIDPTNGSSLYISLNPNQTVVVDHEINIRLRKSDDIIMISLNDLSISQNVIVIDKNGLFN